MKVAVGLFLLAGVSGVVTPSPAPAPAVAPASVEAGRQIYIQNCAGCHGRELEGGIAPSIRAFGKVTAEQLKTALLKGKGLEGQRLRSTMPRFTKGFRPNLGNAPTAQELKSLQLFLKQAK